MIVTFKDPAIFVGNLKAALLAASEDFARPMCCVRLEIRPAAARFVATDGHWMWINEIHCDATGEEILHFELEDVKRIVKTVDDSKKASGWNVELDISTRTVRQLSSSVTFADSPRVFPPYAQVLPATVGGERIIASFDARLMSRVVDAFTAACGKPAVQKGKVFGVPLQFHTTEGKKLKIGKSLEPIVITGGPNAAIAHALAIVMPFQVDVGGPGALLAKYRGCAA